MIDCYELLGNPTTWLIDPPGLLRICNRQITSFHVNYQLLAHGRWFSLGTLSSFTTKIGRHDIAEILLKVTLSTINQINLNSIHYICKFGNICCCRYFMAFAYQNLVSKVDLNPELVVILTNNQSYLTSFTYLWNLVFFYYFCNVSFVTNWSSIAFLIDQFFYMSRRNVNMLYIKGFTHTR
jgi:hypothetical protein